MTRRRIFLRTCSRNSALRTAPDAEKKTASFRSGFLQLHPVFYFLSCSFVQLLPCLGNRFVMQIVVERLHSVYDSVRRYFHDAVCDRRNKFMVMAVEKDNAGEIHERFVKAVDRLKVEMVCRIVE